MDMLPDEIILNIILHLDPLAIARTQLVSRRFYAISRDDTLWKSVCFRHSRTEMRRRQQQLLLAQEPGLVALRQALPSIEIATPSAEMHAYQLALKETKRIMANWDPSYPTEKANFYQEYVQRHAPISLAWLQSPMRRAQGERRVGEALGMGTINRGNDNMVEKIIAPLDDASVCIWDVAPSLDRENTRGKIIARSSPGLLTGTTNEGYNSALAGGIQDTGSVDTVSVDSIQNKAYIGSLDKLIELDIETLKTVRIDTYPFPITALSEAKHPMPVTVGTQSSLHLHDPRVPHVFPDSRAPVRCELIGGIPAQFNDFRRLTHTQRAGSHAPLAQPGPLSILHLPMSTSEWDGNGEIWVAGRFTSLLNYDRRFWPRIRGTVHSGARLSCISSIPYPYIPRELDLMQQRFLSIHEVMDAKAISGRTIIAAGEYKGKGSLELYGLSSDPAYTTLSTDASPDRQKRSTYKNRQRASASRLLSVCAHGTRIVFSDGDGNLKWVERDGKTEVRTFNMNPAISNQDSSLFCSNSSGDIIQKVVPTHGSLGGTLNRDNLAIWTGDGRIGMVGFGKSPAFESRDLEDEAVSVQNIKNIREEREYGRTMREALERHADETRFVRGLGRLGFEA